MIIPHLVRLERGRIVVHLLVALFGVSAWIGVNGIYVQLPVLVNSAPEGWKLPSFLVIVIQAANIGPVIYAVLRYLQWTVKESWSILGILASGTLAMGLLTYFYNKVTTINGSEHSVIFLILTFFSALVGCFSSVLFMPYLRVFKEAYIASYFIGEGLSGVLPSVVALIQGVGGNAVCNAASNNTVTSFTSEPRFSPRVYFWFLFSLLLLSLIAFIILEYSPFVQTQRNNFDTTNATNYNDQVETNNQTWSSENQLHNITQTYNNNNEINTPQVHSDEPLSVLHKCYLLLLLMLFCFLGNGLLPSIQSYSCLPYGNVAYQLSVTLAQFANPVACTLTLWIMPSSIRTINYLSTMSAVLVCYVIYLALASPTPPLQKSDLGTVLVVSSWTLLVGCISYMKLVIVSIFRRITTSKMLFSVGGIMQIGSASGAIVSLILVSFTDLFKVYDPCTS